MNDLDIAVLVPCRNEEPTIREVVTGFRDALPGATVYVYDNGCTDRTAEEARAAGAVVRREPRPGKGLVVRRMFADVEADVYLLVDGDATYDPASAPGMVAALVERQLDMVVAVRRDDDNRLAYRRGHRLGNLLFTGTVRRIFGAGQTDILSGYRCLSRRFVKSFPLTSSGFEIETETAIHSLSLGLPVGEVESRYSGRPDGSESKLGTWRDGFRILRMILLMLKEFRPLAFFGTLGVALAGGSLLLGIPVVVEFARTGLVPRFPTAILAASLMVLSFVMITAGLVLDSVARMRLEMKRLAYLSHRRRAAAPEAPPRAAARRPKAGAAAPGARAGGVRGAERDRARRTTRLPGERS